MFGVTILCTHVEGELQGTQFVSADLTLEIPADRAPNTNNKKVVLGIRPEDVSVTGGTCATVQNYERHGDHTDLFLTLGDTKLSARQHGTSARTDTVDFSIDNSKVHFFSSDENGVRL